MKKQSIKKNDLFQKFAKYDPITDMWVYKKFNLNCENVFVYYISPHSMFKNIITFISDNPNSDSIQESMDFIIQQYV